MTYSTDNLITIVIAMLGDIIHVPGEDLEESKTKHEQRQAQAPVQRQPTTRKKLHHKIVDSRGDLPNKVL